MGKIPSKMMVKHLNLVLEKDGTCLRYIEKNIENGLIKYELEALDQYIDNDYSTPNVTREFEKKVRKFFEEYDVINTGFSNTVKIIYATEQYI